MCRVLSYLGQPVELADLLFRSDSSLVRQTYDPRQTYLLNLAGFGMVAWDRSSHRADLPFAYRDLQLPFYDENLRALAEKLRPHCAIAHIRGVPHDRPGVISRENLHPFRFDGFRIALAHNGDLARMNEMRYDLLEHVKPAIARRIRGTTDSEWIYALLCSQFTDPTARVEPAAICAAVEKTLRILRDVREKRGIDVSSAVNLFIADGDDIVATRFTFDYGCYDEDVSPDKLTYHSLWYTVGSDFGRHGDDWRMAGDLQSADSVIVASEPLSRDAARWVEVPEYSLVNVGVHDGRPRVHVRDLDA